MLGPLRLCLWHSRHMSSVCTASQYSVSACSVHGLARARFTNKVLRVYAAHPQASSRPLSTWECFSFERNCPWKSARMHDDITSLLNHSSLCGKEDKQISISGAHLLAASRLGLGMARRLSPGVPLLSGSTLASDGACAVSLLLLRAGMPSARAAPCSQACSHSEATRLPEAV